MPRVVFVNRFFYPDHSATSQILSDLAFALAEDGLEVHVVTSRLRYEGAGGALEADETLRGVRVHRVLTTTFGRRTVIGRLVDYASFYVSAARSLHALLRPGDLVIAKTDPPLISIVAHRVARRRSASFVNWVQDLYPEIAQRLGVKLLAGPIASLLVRIRRATLKDADATVAIGKRMAQLLAEAGAPPDTLHIIPNWVDEQTLRPVEASDNALRHEWGLAGRFVIAYSGNLGRAHEYATLLDAAELLRERSNLIFLFIGGGHYSSRLEADVRARGLEHIFMFRPYQPAGRLAQSLSAGDVHWISLRPDIEGLIVPSKVYGVMAVGRPVIAVCAADGELADIVLQGGCGLAVRVGDGEALANAIIRLMQDMPLRSSLSIAARAYAEAVSSRHAAIGCWKALIRDILVRGEKKNACMR